MKSDKTRFNFGLIGAGGYIAPRHMKAIKDTGNKLIAALDRFDGVGILDSYFPDCYFFTEPERFDRHLDKLRRQGTENKIDFVSICSPNYLHDAHIRLSLRNDAHAICEKPLVLNPWNLDALSEIEHETGKHIYTILQLRLHPSILALKKKVTESDPAKIFEVDLKYFTSRGRWYYVSWKGDVAKSGGIATNIGVHFFDMLTWVFGAHEDIIVEEHTADSASGYIKLKRAKVTWKLSIDANRLPKEAFQSGKKTFRSITVDGESFEFSDGFTELHTQSYNEILSGRGFGIEDARKSIEIVHAIRNS